MAKQLGFTLIESVAAVLLISAALLAFGLTNGYAHHANLLARQRESAWRIVLNQEAALRSTDYSQLQPMAFSLPVQDLPSGLATVRLRSLPTLTAFEAQFSLSWQSTKGIQQVEHAAVISPFGRSSDVETR